MKQKKETPTVRSFIVAVGAAEMMAALGVSHRMISHVGGVNQMPADWYHVACVLADQARIDPPPRGLFNFKVDLRNVVKAS